MKVEVVRRIVKSHEKFIGHEGQRGSVNWRNTDQPNKSCYNMLYCGTFNLYALQSYMSIIARDYRMLGILQWFAIT